MDLWTEFEVGEIVEFHFMKHGWDFIVIKDEKKWNKLETRFHNQIGEYDDWEPDNGTFVPNVFHVQANMYKVVSHGKWQQDEPE